MISLAHMPNTQSSLHYVYDTQPGYSRVRRGKSFSFVNQKGKPIKSASTIKRLQSLAVPPAYEKIWYCPDPQGYIQAVGFDARGRKQYRYHPDWIAERDAQKYDRMISFAKALPKIRKQTQKDLKLQGLPRAKVLAAVVQLLEKTLIRVGNDEYAKTNKSFGLTTLKNTHVDIHGTKIHFKFKGKSHVVHDIEIEDARLAKVVKQCQALPGYEIFEYEDEEKRRHDVKSNDINEYIKTVCGEEFTAKDFRTWAGTLLAAKALREYKSFTSQTQAKKQILEAIESVSTKLGNTKAVCRKCYIHPQILDAHMDGTLSKLFESRASKLLQGDLKNFSKDEAVVLVLLEKSLKAA